MNFCGYFLKRKTTTKSTMFRGGNFEKSVCNNFWLFKNDILNFVLLFKLNKSGTGNVKE